MTNLEKARFFGYKPQHRVTDMRGVAQESYKMLPENYDNSKDWRAEGAVGPIRNEYAPQICQACWAFAVTATLEGSNFITNGELLEFSPQQLVDCDTGSMGCQGGGIDTSFDYLKTAPIMLDKDYPYVAQDGQCKTDAAKSTNLYVT